jgi:hypothetical protein
MDGDARRLRNPSRRFIAEPAPEGQSDSRQLKSASNPQTASLPLSRRAITATNEADERMLSNKARFRVVLKMGRIKRAG